MRIADGTLLVPDDAGAALPQSAKALAEPISRRLPPGALPDGRVEVARWSNGSQRLTHAGHGYPRPDALLLHCYAPLLAQGTPMGLTEMAHSTHLT